MDKWQFEPMSVGQIIDRAFRLWRANFVRYITMVTVVLVPLFIVQTFWQQGLLSSMEPGNHAPGPGLTVLGGIVYFILAIVGQSLCNMALMKSISESYLGNDLGVGAVYRAVSPRLLSVIGASFLVGLVAGAGFILLIVPGVIFSLWFSVTIPVLILESRGATASMGRSKSLVSGNLGKAFLVGLVVFLIGVIIGYLFYFIGLLVTVPLPPGHIKLLIIKLAGLIGQILAAPIGAAAWTLFYYDLRIRKEGFDLEMLARDIGSSKAQGDAPAAP